MKNTMKGSSWKEKEGNGMAFLPTTKEEMQELLRAQKNIELFFDEEKDPKQTEHSR